MANKFLLASVTALALLILFAGWLLIGPSVPAPVPEVRFKTLVNDDIYLPDLRGNPVLVTFWATDCPSCVKEIPHLIDLYSRFHSRGLEIVAVAMYYDPPNHVVEMSRARQLPYHVALDLRADHAKAFGGVMLTPTTFLISPQGEIVDKILGTFDPRAMVEKIEQLLTARDSAG